MTAASVAPLLHPDDPSSFLELRVESALKDAKPRARVAGELMRYRRSRALAVRACAIATKNPSNKFGNVSHQVLRLVVL